MTFLILSIKQIIKLMKNLDFKSTYNKKKEDNDLFN